MKQLSILSPHYIPSVVKDSSPLGMIDHVVRAEKFIGRARNRAVSAHILGSGKLEKMEFEPGFKPNSKSELEESLKDAYNDAIIRSREFYDKLITTSQQDTAEDANQFIAEVGLLHEWRCCCCCCVFHGCCIVESSLLFCFSLLFCYWYLIPFVALNYFGLALTNTHCHRSCLQYRTWSVSIHFSQQISLHI